MDNQVINTSTRQSRKIVEAYSPERLERLKRLINNMQERGRVKFFSINLDGEMVVPRTNDLEEFDDLLDFIEPHSKLIEIRTFFGNSSNCNTYQFYLYGLPQQPTTNSLNGLGAVEVNEKIQEALHKQQLETQLLLMEKEKQALADQVLQLKKKMKKYKNLQTQLDEKKIDINDLLTKGIELLGVFQAKKNGSNAPIQGLPNLPPSEVELVEEKTPAQDHFEQLKDKYSDDQLLRAMKTSEVFVKYPELREEFQAIVKSKKQQHE